MRRQQVGLALLLLWTVTAQAGPPMITNDPDTPGTRRWEINLAVTGGHSASSLDIDAPDLDFNRGVGERVQLSLHIASAHAREAGVWRSGLSDVELGVRYRLLDEEDDGISLALQPLYVRGWSPTARRHGLASAHPEWVLPVQAARGFGDFTAAIEVARHFITQEPDAWQAGVLVSHDCLGGDCLAEINATRADGGDARATINIGARHPLREGLSLMGSLGRERGDDELAATVFYLGILILH